MLEPSCTCLGPIALFRQVTLLSALSRRAAISNALIAGHCHEAFTSSDTALVCETQQLRGNFLPKEIEIVYNIVQGKLINVHQINWLHSFTTIEINYDISLIISQRCCWINRSTATCSLALLCNSGTQGELDVIEVVCCTLQFGCNNNS